MMKERVKSFILITLVIFTLVLAERILVDKKLWPTGYNFFSIGTNFKKADRTATENLTTPERIIVNTGYQSSRFEYLRGSSEFKEIFSKADEIIKDAFSSPARDVSQISSDSWYSALTGKSIYFSYSTSFSAHNFSELIGTNRTEMPFKNFCDIVIGENGALYVNDGDAYYEVDTTSQEIADIIESALVADTENQSVINYSFDLNFDKEFGSEKTILSPMIPIYSGPVEAEVILSENPIIKDDGIDQKTVNGILNAFSINSNTTWRYTEADGTLVFVENTGILKISPNGILTFTASDAGLPLPSAGSNTHEVVSGVATFIDSVNSAINQNAEMSITSPLNADNIQAFTFDYTVGGIPVKYSGKNGVTVTTKNGYITEYSQILRRYEPCGYTEFSPLYIEALDNIIAKYQASMNQINIKKMFPAYMDNLEGGEKTPDWYIEIDNVVAE